MGNPAQITSGPLGPPPILTPVPGWLSLLGLKSGGQQPAHALDTLSPTLDMTVFYLSGLIKGLGSSSTTFTTAGANDTTIGPAQGRVWLVDSVSCDMQFTAAAAMNAAMYIRGPQGSYHRRASPTVAIQATDIWAVLAMHGPFIMVPGETVVIVLSHVLTAMASLTFVVSGADLPS